MCRRPVAPLVPGTIASIVSSDRCVETARVAFFLARMLAPGSVPAAKSNASTVSTIHSSKSTRMACFPARMPAQESLRLCLHPVATLVASVVSAVSKRRACHLAPRGCLPKGRQPCAGTCFGPGCGAAALAAGDTSSFIGNPIKRSSGPETACARRFAAIYSASIPKPGRFPGPSPGCPCGAADRSAGGGSPYGPLNFRANYGCAYCFPRQERMSRFRLRGPWSAALVPPAGQPRPKPPLNSRMRRRSVGPAQFLRRLNQRLPRGLRHES